MNILIEFQYNIELLDWLDSGYRWRLLWYGIVIMKRSFLSSKWMKLMPISVSVNVDAAVFFFGVIIMRLVFQHCVHHHSLIDIINCNLSCAYNLLFCTSNWLYVLSITLSIRKTQTLTMVACSLIRVIVSR